MLSMPVQRFYRLIDTFFESIGAQCLICGEPGHPHNICEYCHTKLPRNTPACYFCARPIDAEICGQCLMLKPHYRLIAPFLYQRPLDKLIYQLKFKATLSHAKLFGELLAEELLLHYAEQTMPEVIIPIPLSRHRYCERGFNQSLEIAKVIAKRYQIPIDNHLCYRQIHTQAQARLAYKERKMNIRGAFIVADNAYDHIALVDDVVTTGATIDEVSQRCKDAGIKNIDVWSATRAARH